MPRNFDVVPDDRARLSGQEKPPYAMSGGPCGDSSVARAGAVQPVRQCLAADGRPGDLLAPDAVAVRVKAVRVWCTDAEVAVRNVRAAEVRRRDRHTDVGVADAVAVLGGLRRRRRLPGVNRWGVIGG